MRSFLSSRTRSGIQKTKKTFKSPKLLSINIALALILNLLSPLLTYSSVFAEPTPIPNELILTDERGDALFINKNPGFTAEFGQKADSGKPIVTFSLSERPGLGAGQGQASYDLSAEAPAKEDGSRLNM